MSLPLDGGGESAAAARSAKEELGVRLRSQGRNLVTAAFLEADKDRSGAIDRDEVVWVARRVVAGHGASG